MWLRMRVFRVAQPLTVLSLEIWQIFVIVIGFIIALSILQQIYIGIIPILGGIVTSYLFMRVVTYVKDHTHPGAALHFVRWMVDADTYTPTQDLDTTPLLLPKSDKLNEEELIED